MKRAYLVVDMTNDFIEEDGALTCGRAGQIIVQPILHALELAYEQKELIVFACDAHAVNDAEFALWPAHCVEGTSGAQLVSELHHFYEHHKGEHVRFLPKTKYDAFYDTALEQWLLDEEIREVVICGVCTSICCYATASGAYYRGYRVYIDPSLMADLTETAHEFALQHMQNVLKAQLVEK